MSDDQNTPPPAPDPNEVLPGGLTRAAALDLKRTNPILWARYSNAHGVSIVDPADADPHGWRRASASRGAPTLEQIAAATSWARRGA